MQLSMTTGKPSKQIIKFMIPMFVGNLFQQLYNVVDTIVVGKFVSHTALAAVGASFAIMTFITSIIIGLAMGASILFSQLYGAGKNDLLKKAVSTAFIFIISVSLLISILSYLFTAGIVQLYQMPPGTVQYSIDYLQFIFAGLIFAGIYNFSAFLLRSLGDSKSPLYFLVLACILNIILDLVFVLIFHLEVKGVAAATFIAQAVSAVLSLFYAFRKLRKMNIGIDRIYFDRPLFKKILEFSILASIQQSIMNFGILLVQGLVNTFGTIITAGFSAAVKIDAFAYMPLQDFGNAFSTFTAQNTGAGKHDRIKEGLLFCVKAILLFSFVVSFFVLMFSEHLISIFVKQGNIEVISAGVKYLRLVGGFYFLIGFLFLFYGFFRGLGNSFVSIVLTVISLGCRVLLAYGFAYTFLGYNGICISIPIGWLLADLAGLYFYKKIFVPLIHKSNEL